MMFTPILKQWWFKNQPIKNGGWTSRDLLIHGLYLWCGPLPVTVTTRIITFLFGDPYKSSFTTVTGRGPAPKL